MSNALAVATVTAALRKKLSEAVSEVPGAKVTSQRPEATPHKEPVVNVYLYQTTPNTAWRNTELPTRGPGGNIVQRSQAALDLHYLLSFYGEESTLVPERLLGSVVQRLHERPVLTRKLIESTVPSFDYLKGSDLAEESELVRLTPSALSLEELSKLWSIFFQCPYVLSVAYQATVVLIDGVEEPRPALPVRTRHIEVAPLRRPTIEEVVSDNGAEEPVLSGGRLCLRGRCLRGKRTRVRIGATEIEPEKLTDTEIVISLSSDSLRAGVLPVQVVHASQLDTPAAPHPGPASNAAAVVLRPRVVSLSMTGKQPEKKPHPVRPIPPPVVSVEIRPKVGKDQRVALLLWRSGDGEPRTYSLSTPLREEDGDVIEFSVADVRAGDYLASVQVDGAESPLEPDPDPERGFIGPKVTVT